MPKYETNDIRNIAFIGHGDSGKTTLADTMLFKTGEVKRCGSIADGSSVFDFEPEEKERKSSVDLAVATVNYKGKTINIIDAPGYPDFTGDAISALAAVEASVLCINASSGIMVNTRKMWNLAKSMSVPVVIMITKIDMENVNCGKLIGEIVETFGNETAAIVTPGGQSGVTNILKNREQASKELQEIVDKSVEKMMELDDKILEEYLNGETVSLDEIHQPLRDAIRERRIFPILVSSAVKDAGVGELLDFIVEFLPSPGDVGPKTGVDPVKEGEIKRAPVVSAPFSGQVFKSISDPFLGKLSYFRVFSGRYTPDAPIYNQRTGKAERVGNLFKPFGKDQRNIAEAIAGDIVGVTKIDDLHVCDTVCAPEAAIKYPLISFPTPMVSLAAEPKTKADEQRLTASLHKMSESDPTFKVGRNKQTLELVISGMSQLHIDVILMRLKRKYDVHLVTHQPKVAYLETITGKSDGHHKHKKQSGGRGQYGEVRIRLEPTVRGEGFKFVDEVVQGRIPNQYIPAVEKGIREVLDKGVLAGHQVVDVQVTLYDGSYHDVDSSEAAFKIAASKAFKEAFMNAHPSLLEPIVNIEIAVPSRNMGDITGDLNSRRGRIIGMDSQGTLQVIKAQIPLGEITTYSTELRSITGGEGSYSIDFSHYDVVPQRIAESIIARSAKKEETDEE